MAGKNAAKWLEDGKIIDVPGPELFAHHWEVEIPEFGKLEGYPNRNSVPYVDIYGIKNTKTMFRGTLRYPGWCAAMKKIVDLGFLDDEKEYDLAGLSYADFMKNFVDVKTHKTLKENLAAQWELPVDANPIYRVEWLGLLSHEKIGLEKGTAMDVFCNALNEKLTYEPGERDLLVLHHEFIAEFQDKKQHITSTMIDYGIPNGDSSMSRTVGLPAAIAVKLILEGKIQEKGVKIPVDPEIYLPVLDELKNQNIECVERFEDM